MCSTEPGRFKKAKASGGQNNCVEVDHRFAHIRDSKNPNGPMLHVDVATFLSAIKEGRFG
jgi:hypothetical protein